MWWAVRKLSGLFLFLSGRLKSFLKFVDLVEDNDDVQNVWHNAEYDEDEEA